MFGLDLLESRRQLELIRSRLIILSFEAEQERNPCRTHFDQSHYPSIRGINDIAMKTILYL